MKKCFYIGILLCFMVFISSCQNPRISNNTNTPETTNNPEVTNTVTPIATDELTDVAYNYTISENEIFFGNWKITKDLNAELISSVDREDISQLFFGKMINVSNKHLVVEDLINVEMKLSAQKTTPETYHLLNKTDKNSLIFESETIMVYKITGLTNEYFIEFIPINPDKMIVSINFVHFEVERV